MGIKLLNLNTIPWCFQLFGNHLSCFHLPPTPVEDTPVASIKLISSDGLVKIYDRPVQVSDLMTEFPKHMVCRSDSFYIGQKIPAMSENDQLQLGQKYFLLPKQFFQTALSFVTIASFAHAPSPVQSRHALLKNAANSQPFLIQKSSSGCLRIRISDEFLWQLMEKGGMKETTIEDDEDAGGLTKVCNTQQLQKRYVQLVGSKSHQWKPKLETIKEVEKRKISSSFGMKRKMTKKKSQPLIKTSQKNRRSSFEQQVHLTSCAKPKIKIKSRK